MGDGWETTVYLVRHPRATTSVRVVVFPETRSLDQWCAANDKPEAIVAGFFLRDPYRPLGEVRIDGALVEHEPVAAPWGRVRGCVQVDDGLWIAPLVHRKHLLNRPYSHQDQPAPESRPVVTALLFEPRPAAGGG